MTLSTYIIILFKHTETLSYVLTLPILSSFLYSKYIALLDKAQKEKTVKM